MSRNQPRRQNRLCREERGRAQPPQAEEKSRRKEGKQDPSKETKVRKGCSKGKKGSSLFGPWGSPEQVVRKGLKGCDECFRKVTLGVAGWLSQLRV